MDRRFPVPQEAVERPLTPSERRLLEQSLSWRRRHYHSRRGRALQAFLFVTGPLWLLSLLASHFSSHEKIHWSIITGFWLIFGAAITLWGYIPESRRLAFELRKLETAVLRNQGIVVEIRSNQMVEFEEIEDEGACYAFDLGNGRIRFVSGQDYYPSARFPNSDFALVHIVSAEGELLEHIVSKYGKKLKPLRTVSAEVKSRLTIPEDLAIVQGTLDDLERLLS